MVMWWSPRLASQACILTALQGLIISAVRLLAIPCLMFTCTCLKMKGSEERSLFLPMIHVFK